MLNKTCCRVIAKGKAHVGEWLKQQGLGSYVSALEAAEVARVP